MHSILGYFFIIINVFKFFYHFVSFMSYWLWWLWSHRLFLHSCWGWTCILCGSFIFLLSYCISNSFIHSVRHLFRLAVAGTLWTLFRRLLSFLVDASGSCFEPLQSPTDVRRNPEELLDSDTGPLLLLREEKGKAACLKAGLQWQGCEVSDDILILSLCCLILAEEIGVFRPCMALGKPVGTPLRMLFLLCVLLMSLWIFLIVCLLAHFPLFPSQLVGGALGYLGWKGLYYKGWCVLKPGWCCVGRPKALLSDNTCNTASNGKWILRKWEIEYVKMYSFYKEVSESKKYTYLLDV